LAETRLLDDAVKQIYLLLAKEKRKKKKKKKKKKRNRRKRLIPGKLVQTSERLSTPDTFASSSLQTGQIQHDLIVARGKKNERKIPRSWKSMDNRRAAIVDGNIRLCGQTFERIFLEDAAGCIALVQSCLYACTRTCTIACLSPLVLGTDAMFLLVRDT